jgi:DNA-binding Lrp family transcriptional regulator
MHGYGIDEYDIYILRILARNCRAPFRNISRDIGITASIVKNRIEIVIYGYFIKGLFI